ncbi:MAG: two-component system, cell cycle sensor histidine kinase and response regulator CckA, partial [Thermodesulfobacteriota bacterium]|nr:two-component system, cell cycle sensor histidine kinase and response regulator CckA [Thermodesulfobacteriota bacterium]
VLNQFVISAFVAGVTASVAVSHAPVTYCYVSSVLLTALPLAGRFFYEGGEIYSLLGLVVLLYAASMIGLGRSVHSMIVSVLSLEMEKTALVNQLQQAGQDLEFRIEERTVDLRRSEERLRLEKQKFERLAENSPFGMVVIQSDGTFAYANPKFIEMFGYDLNEVKNGRAWFGKAYPDATYRKEVIAAWIEDRRGGDGAQSRPRIFTVTCKDGTEKVIHFRPVSLDSGEDLMTSEDITSRVMAENSVRESEERYRAMFSYMKSGVAVFSAEDSGRDFSFVDFNPSAEGISRIKKDELIGRRLLDKFPNMSKTGLLAALQRVHRTGVSEHLPPFYYTDADREGWRDNFIYKLPSGDLVVIYDDVTERKQAEEAIRESEEKYRSLFEDSIDGIFVTEVDGTLIDANQSFFDLFGYRKEEMLGTSVTKTYASPADRKRFQHAVEKQGSIRDFYLRLIRKDGSEMDCLLTATVRRTIDGNILGYRGIVRDFTERKRFEEELQKLASVVQHSTELVNLAALDGTMIFLNEAGSRMLGIDPRELGQMNIMEVIPDHLKTKVRTELLPTLMKHHAWEGDLQYLNLQTGKLTDVHALAFTIQDPASKEPVYLANVSLDITERKNLESQLLQAQKMEAVGTLAGGIAHDFNNLLQVVIGYSELLLAAKEQSESQRESLRKIHTAARRGADLVRNLLTFSRKVEPKFRPVDLNHEVVEFQKLLSRTIPKIIRINLRLNGDLEPIEADPSQINQILMNLGVNSRDAMPDGGTLTIETKTVELDRPYSLMHPEVKPGRYAMLSISDTGQGMDEATMARIFDPFFSTKGVGKGTGLGLAIVYGIVKQHGGHITCHSELGQGTIFKMYFPCAEAADREESVTEDVPVQGGSETILLVDDEEVLRDLCSAILGEFGYKVITAENGREALEIYEAHREEISLIILDLIMPEMDGTTCLKEILLRAPDARVLMASGYSNSETLKDTEALGAKGFVEKPYNTRELLQTVREILDAH